MGLSVSSVLYGYGLDVVTLTGQMGEHGDLRVDHADNNGDIWFVIFIGDGEEIINRNSYWPLASRSQEQRNKVGDMGTNVAEFLI